MKNLIFFSYIIASFMGFAGVALSWSVSVQSRSEHDRLFWRLFALSAVNLAASLAFFLIFYLSIVVGRNGTSNALRIVGYCAGYSIFYFWVRFSAEALGEGERHYISIAAVITLVTVLSFSVISSFFMDGYYYIRSGIVRSVYMAVNGLCSAFSIFLLVRICVQAAKTILGSTTRRYIYIVSLTLCVNLILRFLVDNRGYGVNLGELRFLSFVEPSAFSGLITNTATMIFVVRTNFSPLYQTQGRTDPENEQKENPIATLAVRHHLTSREKEVAEMLCRGLTYVDIAECMNISVNTVKRHIHNCYEKLGIASRYELMFIVSSHNNTNE